ncbi:RNA polymerase sigma factor [Telluribacter sp. SYSU D00476]|uniref:RNA polymerase sigma factor n=1 Tax=Telluribacter sp. SYSU D00476 TaxID=2811430 RepID=UPI001FF4A4FB|nr:sigma-70 family RNA polymerase sigma factor [Telluribacter sp. SYSU D00476]
MAQGLQHTTDEVLWHLYRQGNEAALAVIYERYVKSLYAYGRKFNTETALVKDCIQDLFADLLSKPHSVSQTPNVRNYLMKSLRRRILAVGSKHTFGEVPDDYAFGLIPSYEQELIQAQSDGEEIRQVQEAIQKLTRRQQEIIYLKFYHDLDNHSIAEVMSLTYQAVCNLISKAIKAIRDLLTSSTAMLALYYLSGGLD